MRQTCKASSGQTKKSEWKVGFKPFSPFLWSQTLPIPEYPHATASLKPSKVVCPPNYIPLGCYIFLNIKSWFNSFYNVCFQTIKLKQQKHLIWHVLREI